MTGQVGMNKKPYLEAVVDLAGTRGGRIDLAHVGDLMYAESPDITPGRILDIPLKRLHLLRRSVLKDIIAKLVFVRISLQLAVAVFVARGTDSAMFVK